MNDDALRLLQFEEMKGLFAPYLASGLGKAALARLLPSHDPEEVRRRLDTAAEVRRAGERGLLPALGGLHDLAPLLDAVREKGRPMEPEELLRVRETLECAARVTAAVERCPTSAPDLPLPRLAELVGEIPGFTVLTDRIGEVLDERGRVRDSASARLSGVRSEVRVVRERIERKVADLLSDREVRRCFQEGVPRFRSGRVVLPVKAERRSEVRGILHDVSQTGATCFVEPECVVPEGNALEDLIAEESREVNRILWETTVRVLEFERPIRGALSALARFELAAASAQAAKAEGLCFPRLRDDGVLRLRAARHPVLQLLRGREGVVPVDLRLGDDFRVLVITGPNTGGKTASLKTAGLIALMAQSGLPVPAEEAETTVFSDVLADIGDEQSLQQNLSTFSSHMSRIAQFLGLAGGNTLVLLDELGAGTDPAEGAALGRAILDWLLERGVRAIVTTHLGALKTYAFTRGGVLNASVEFDVDTLSPTYRLVLGQAGASNALVIAERLGLPAEVVRRARGLVRPEDLESQEVLRSAQEIRSRAESHLREADGVRRDTARLHEAAEEAVREANDRRQVAALEADDEMEATMARLRRFVTEFAREMRNAPKPFGPRAEEFLARAETEIRATPLARRREEFAAGLRKGDEVWVPKLKERFRVHAVRRKDRTLCLVRGSIRVEVPFADVSWVGC